MSVVLLGVLLLAAGVGLAFFGLRAFVILLPAFGLITGFFLGASIVASCSSSGFGSIAARTSFLHSASAIGAPSPIMSTSSFTSSRS